MKRSWTLALGAMCLIGCIAMAAWAQQWSLREADLKQAALLQAEESKADWTRSRMFDDREFAFSGDGPPVIPSMPDNQDAPTVGLAGAQETRIDSNKVVEGIDEPNVGPDSLDNTTLDWDARRRQLLKTLPPNITPESGVPEQRLAELRQRARETEQQSIQFANVVRETLKRQDSDKPAASRKSLEIKLRRLVLEAFKARHDLHFMEVTSLTMKAQAMNTTLTEREASYADIVDRRVDDLLNPAKLWTTESPVFNEITPAGSSAPGDDNKLLIRKSDTSVKVEGEFNGNEEVLLIIGEPKVTSDLKWTVPLQQAGAYVIEVRRDTVNIDGGKTAPGMVFQVRSVPDRVNDTSNIAFTDTDPLPNGKVVISPQGNKLVLKRKTDVVLVLVGHVQLPDASTVPIHIMIRRTSAN